jgi:amino acid adenylation domain-containing protein/FkbM family methyltransferase
MHREVTEAYRVSPQQERVWRLLEEDKGQAYHALRIVDVQGRLDYERLRSAVKELMNRYEILRTRFESVPGMSLPVQMITDWVEPAVEILDASNEGKQAQQETIAYAIERVRGRAREYDRDSALDIYVIKLSETDHRLVIGLPALCADSRTLKHLVGEIVEEYSSKTNGSRSADQVTQYVQFSQWQIDLQEDGGADAGWHYQKEQLASFHYALPLPLEKSTSAEGPFSPDSVYFAIGPDTFSRLNRMANEHNISISTLLLSAWQALLLRLTGQSDLVIGVMFDGRKYEEMQSALGLFAKYVPVRFHLETSDQFSQLFSRTDNRVQEVADYEEYFAWSDSRDYSELETAYCFVGYEYDREETSYSTDDLTLHTSSQYACFDRFKVKLGCLQKGDSLIGDFQYDQSSFDRESIERMATQFQTLIESMICSGNASVGEVNIVPRRERERLLVEFNSTEKYFRGEKCVHKLFESQVAQHAEDLAVDSGNERLSYAQLNERANQLARYLKSIGVGPEQFVAICLNRSASMVESLLAVLKAGAAFLPLDSTYPKERLNFILEDTRATVVLTQSALAENFVNSSARVICVDTDWDAIAFYNGENLAGETVADNAAYVIYTSGSTGQPKGVVVTHRSMANHLCWANDTLCNEVEWLPVVTKLSFDPSFKQVIGPLLRGKAVWILSDETVIDPRALLAAICARKQVGLNCVPTLWKAILDELDSAHAMQLADSLDCLFLGGEQLSKELISETLGAIPDLRLWNLYGPTETTTNASAARIYSEESWHIGQAVANGQIYIMEQNLQPSPIGVVGEIYIGGEGVARGYLNRSELTANGFIPDPFSREPGTRMYKSGDLARYRPDGNIEFVGRIDHQVKVHGFRIELGEIEAALREHAGVDAAVVIAKEDAPNDKRLVAYVVPNWKYAPTISGKRRYKLANNLAIAHVNKNETDFLYHTMFEAQDYLKHGITIKDGDCIFDVGSNIGLFTLFAHLKNKDVTIYGFEPNPFVYEALRLNTSLYEVNAKVFEFGLSNERKTAAFTFYPKFTFLSGIYADTDADKETVRSFIRNQKQSGETDIQLSADDSDDGLGPLLEDLLEDRFESKIFNVELKTVSEMMRQENVKRINLLKINVEKSEYDVIAGIAESDWEKIDQVAMELHDIDGRLEKTCSLLKKHGFDLAVEQDWVLEKSTKTNYYIYAKRGSRAESSGHEYDRSIPVVEDSMISSGKLRSFLKEKLPEYMLPSAIVLMESLPLTANGKVDRKALPSPDEAGLEAENTFVAPRTAIEQVLACIWAEILFVDQVGVYDNFFELGGHSLLATNLFSKINHVFKIDMSMRTLFESPTLVGLAEKIEQATLTDQALQAPPILPVPRNIDLPLSFAQQRLWFIDQLEPGSTLYNNPAALRMRGNLNVEALDRTWTEIVRQHESLRTVIVSVNDRIKQEIKSPEDVVLPILDLRSMDEVQQEAEVLRLALQEAEQPFNLQTGPLWRLNLLKLAEQDHVLLITVHHIVSDAWSVAVLVRDVMSLYTAFCNERPSPLKNLPIQYADFAYWQRQWLKGEVLESLLAYWKRKLGNDLPVLILPASHAPTEKTAFRGARHMLTFSKGMKEAILSFSHQRSVTPFMVFLGVFQTMLHFYTSQDDVPVTTSIANRNRPETENLIGFFVNTLVLCTDLSGDPTFEELLARVREVTLEAYAHQDLPYEKLLEAMPHKRSQKGELALQAKIALQNAPIPLLALSGLSLRFLDIEYKTVRDDLLLNLLEDQEGLYGSLDYNAELLDSSTVGRMARHFNLLLRAVLLQPKSRLSALKEILAQGDERHEDKEIIEAKKRNVRNLQNVKRVAIPVSGD